MKVLSSAVGVSKSGGRIDRTISPSLPYSCGVDRACAKSTRRSTCSAAAAIAREVRTSRLEIIAKDYSVPGAAACSGTRSGQSQRNERAWMRRAPHLHHHILTATVQIAHHPVLSRRGQPHRRQPASRLLVERVEHG